MFESLQARWIVFWVPSAIFHRIVLAVRAFRSLHVTCSQLRDPTNLWARDPLSKTFTSTEGPTKIHIRWVPERCFLHVTCSQLRDPTNPWARDPLSKTFTSTEGPTKIHIRWVPEGCFRGCKSTGAWKWNTSIAEIEIEWRCTFVRPCVYVFVVCTGTLPLAL